jgi:acyl-CoA reductase-like NAD-dependent aldehyde dehydrogenase
MGALLSQHESVHKIVFTGSTATGRKVMASAAPTLKALTLELGGNDPAIVLPHADIGQIAESLFWGAFINSGQTCGALKRLYVHESVHDSLCDALVACSRKVSMGDGMVRANTLGPLQNRPQFEKIIALVDDARRCGGQVLVGGVARSGPGYFYPVTLVAGMRDGMRLVDEEQFGPALPIISYSDVDDAVRRANASSFGLNASVWGSDPLQVRHVAEQLEAGTVWINKHAEISPHVPMGGIKSSGIGVEFGQDGLEAYTRIKVINARAG